MNIECAEIVQELRGLADVIRRYGTCAPSAIEMVADKLETKAVAGEAVDLPGELDTSTLVLQSNLISCGVPLSPNTCRKIAAEIITPLPMRAKRLFVWLPMSRDGSGDDMAAYGYNDAISDVISINQSRFQFYCNRTAARQLAPVDAAAERDEVLAAPQQEKL